MACDEKNRCACHETLRALLNPVKVVRNDGAVYGMINGGLGMDVNAKPILLDRAVAEQFCAFNARVLGWKLELVIVEVEK